MSTLNGYRAPGGILAMLGVWIAIAGFGLLAFDAAIGVLAIPAGVVLAIVGMPRPGPRRAA